MQTALKKAYNQITSIVDSPYADYFLALFFFLDAIAFIPAEPILVMYCFKNPARTWWYVAVATGASVLGGLVSYALGYILWSYVGHEIIHSWFVKQLISPENFAYACQQFKAHQAWALIIAGFMPIPFKAATFSAGICSLSLMPFIISVAIARGARFFVCAYITKKGSPYLQEYIDRYLPVFVLCVLLIIIGIVALKRM